MLNKEGPASAVERELEWLLHDYFPAHLESVLAFLRASWAACTGSEFPSSSHHYGSGERVGSMHGEQVVAPLFPSATLVLSTANRTCFFLAGRLVGLQVRTDVLKGFVTLEGGRISKAEIQLHFAAWNRGNPLSLHLDTRHPVELAQIIDCGQLIRLAIDHIEDLQMGEQANCRAARDTLALLQQTIQCCRSAIRTIEHDDSKGSMTPAIFIGAPDDLLFSFGIQQARLVASACIATNSPTSSSIGAGNTHRSSSFRTTLSSLSLPSTPSDFSIRVESIVPALTAAHEMLQHAVRILVNLAHTLSIIQNVDSCRVQV